MRTALTVGILKNGEAEIIHQPTVPMDKQRASFRDMGAAKKDSKYVEIRYIPSRGKSMTRRFTSARGGVNHNAANRVVDQGNKKKVVDFTPAEGKGAGRVNFDASIKVADQGRPAEKKSARARKSAAKKSAKKTAPHTSGAKGADVPPASSAGADASGGPTL